MHVGSNHLIDAGACGIDPVCQVTSVRVGEPEHGHEQRLALNRLTHTEIAPLLVDAAPRVAHEAPEGGRFFPVPIAR